MEESEKYPKYYYNAADNKVLVRKSDLKAIIFQSFQNKIILKTAQTEVLFQRKDELDRQLLQYHETTQAKYIEVVKSWLVMVEIKVAEIKPHFKKQWLEFSGLNEFWNFKK